MSYRTGFILALFAGSTFALLPVDAAHSAPENPAVPAQTQPPAPAGMTGKVKDIVEAAGYTYAQVDTGKEFVWAATSTTPLQKGEVITFSTSMPMYNFHSKALNRDFPVIYFSDHFVSASEHSGIATTPLKSPHAGTQAATDAKPVEGIQKVEGGNTIAEIYADRQKLAGKTVRVRGKATKYTAGVMGKNWIHIRDSSSPEDLTITTDGTAAINDVLVIEGKLATDKDLGYGYVYPVIVEDARVTRE
jgi:hypothetical protein